jgi:hypothetical protein
VTQQPSGALRTFSIHARVMPDGTVEGEYDNHNRQQGFINHGEINCMRFLSYNDVVLSGIVRKSDNPNAPPGATTVFRVVDHGEGADDPPDQVSQVLNLPLGSTADCNTITPTILFALEGGNIQVRP